MKVNIDLGIGGEPGCAPTQAADDKKYYPSIHYSGKKELGIPKEGTMVIRYKEVGHAESENSKGEESYSCTIEVREIVSVEGEEGVEMPASNRGKSSEDALDKIHALLMEKKGKSEDY